MARTFTSVSRWIVLAAFGGILLFGAWLRIAGTLSHPLWIDESYSAYIADKDLAWIWTVVPRFETHPPFYYSILRGWTLVFGDALATRRALGIVAGLATIPAAALAAREIGRLIVWDRRRTLWAMIVVAALVALSSLMIEMTRQVRPYPVLILVHAVALAALLRVGRTAAEEQRLPAASLLLYLVALGCVLWLHNLGMFSAAALGLSSLVLLLGRGLARRDWLLLWGGYAIVGLAYLPAFAMLLDQATGWTAATWLKFEPADLPWAISRLLGAPGRPALLLTLLLGTGGLVALVRARDGWRVAVVLLLTGLLPIALSLAVTILKTPVFIPRTLSAVTVPALLLVAIGVAGSSGTWRWPSGVALLGILALLVRTDLSEFRQKPGQDWYGAVDWLAAHVRPGDEVWAYPNDAALPLHYAARDRGYVGLVPIIRAQPGPVPVLDAGPDAAYPTGNRGVVTLPRARLRALVDNAARDGVRTIWLLRLGRDMFDPADDFPAAFSGWRRIAGCESDPIRVMAYRNDGTADVAPESGPCSAPVSPPR